MLLPLFLAGCCPPNREPCGGEGVHVRMSGEIHRVSGDSEQARTGEAAVVTGRWKT